MSNEFSAPGYGAPPPIATTSGKGGKKKGGDKTPTKRSSTTLGLLTATFAVVVGLLAVFLITSSSSTMFVVRTINSMQPLTEVTQDMVEVVEIDPLSAEPNSFTGATAQEALGKAGAFVEGKWLRYPVGEHRQLRTEDFSTLGDIGTPLAPDERMISVVAKAADSVAGEIKPGDRVDFYGVDPEKGSGLLASNIEILSATIMPDQFDAIANQQMGSPNLTLDQSVPGAPVPGTYVVRVKAVDVPRFAAVNRLGGLYIALRPKDAVDVVPGKPLTAGESLCSDTTPWLSCGTGDGAATGGAVGEDTLNFADAAPATELSPETDVAPATPEVPAAPSSATPAPSASS